MLRDKYRVQHNGNDIPSDEVFVLRQSDVLASPTLYSYASSISTSLELDETYHFLTREQRKYYETLRDDVLVLADKWYETNQTKLPD